MIKMFLNANYKLLSWLVIPILVAYVFSSYLLKFNLNFVRIMGRQVKAAGTETQLNKYIVERPDFPVVDLKNKGVVTFWFDDGWRSQYEVAFPILEKAGIKGAIAVTTNYPSYGGYASWDELRDLQKNGWETTSHGVTHLCDETMKNVESYYYEMEQSQKVLFYEGLRNDHYVSPCGIDSQDLKTFAKAHYKSYRTAYYGINDLPLKDRYDLKAVSVDQSFTIDEVKNLLRTAKRNHAWVILMFHQVNNSGGEYAVTPDYLSQIIKTVQDYDLDVVVPSQIIN